AISFLYFGGLHLWPGALAGDLMVNDYGALTVGAGLAQSAGNLAEVIVATALIRRLVPEGSPLQSVRGLGRLLASPPAPPPPRLPGGGWRHPGRGRDARAALRGGGAHGQRADRLAHVVAGRLRRRARRRPARPGLVRPAVRAALAARPHRRGDHPPRHRRRAE